MIYFCRKLDLACHKSAGDKKDAELAPRAKKGKRILWSDFHAFIALPRGLALDAEMA